MPFGKYEVSEPIKVPTFLQWIKTIGKGVEGKTKFRVELIWLPGQFNNVTLQTHAFRYICDEGHPLYTATIEYSLELLHRDITPELQIVVLSIPEKTIEVLENPKKQVKWTSLSKNAYKCKDS